MDEIKVICCDIDGTLVRDDKSLSEENKKWIYKAVKEKGIHFTLVSGRMANGVRPFYDEIGINGPVSCYNGGTLVDEEGNIVEDLRMPHDLALSLVRVGHKVQIGMILFDGMTWFLEEKDDYIYPWKTKIYQSDSGIGPFEELLKTFDTNKVIYMSPSAEKLEEAKAEVLRTVDRSRITMYRSGNFLEVMPSGYDKGSAIDALSDYYKVPASQIMALGDDYNDIPMLKKAGWSVAMGNAVPEAKAAAKYITDTNNNDGVAKAIRRYIYNY